METIAVSLFLEDANSLQPISVPIFPDPYSSSSAEKLFSHYIVASSQQSGSRLGLQCRCATPEKLDGEILLFTLSVGGEEVAAGEYRYQNDEVLELDLGGGRDPAYGTGLGEEGEVQEDGCRILRFPVMEWGIGQEVDQSEKSSIILTLQPARSVLKAGVYYESDLWPRTRPNMPTHADLVPTTDPIGRLPWTWRFNIRTLSHLSSLGLRVEDISSYPPEYVAEHTYCICRQVLQDGVVACDNEWCRIKYWHKWCAGLVGRQMAETLWLCPECVRLPRGEVVVNGVDMEGSHGQEEQKCRCAIVGPAE